MFRFAKQIENEARHHVMRDSAWRGSPNDPVISKLINDLYSNVVATAAS